ncbi:delta-lactam-biosynthetic de-N-acetylase [Clostridium massiliodielmoense]|uniref:delta-lactam-biosynthetic de-N-acetylase n=1 Tax=Clostridium massiliodielmoense TaxID=1776385 RepID=UPI0004D4BA7C|nr:delta-lactam-biosynthetic de-N-acetylase [Clostridium massiliodielmoense]KEH98822.1 delta-lactam-biosynthetic de-N-acetylase [Clostridium botulinum C/D str. BKT12695]
MKISKLLKNLIIVLVIIGGLSVSLLSKNFIISSHKNSTPTSSYSNNVDPTNSSSLDTKEYNWYFKHVKNGVPPVEPPETASFFSKYDTYFLGDTSKKVIYLTFDEGYENGYTAPILDVLKKHKVPAAFFVVKPYVDTNPDLVKRMVEEGHLVCNHSWHHPSMASIHDKEKFNRELSEVEKDFEKLTGKKMPHYFRPPMGKYSEQSLAFTKDYGYKSVFWSFAYADWDPKKQPSHESAKKKILNKTHNGAIMLLHAVSKTNAEILDEIITEWKKQGYELRPLSDL